MGLRGPKAKGQKDWMIPVADLMIKEHMSFTSAAMACGVKFTSGQEEVAAKYSDEFQNILDSLSYKFYARIGGNPLLTKEVVTGTLVTAIRRLGESDQWDKVAIPAKLLSDIMGLTRESSEQPVFANLSQKDIDEIRAKVQAAEKAEAEKTRIVSVVKIDGEPN